jgi:muramidase (phage lysozyme)
VIDAVNCAAWLANRNVQAFLRMLRVGEGTADDAGYRRHFGGELFDNFVDHPRRPVTRRLGEKTLTSTAAGAYQFLAGTWDECKKALGLRDFTPPSQDLAAVYLIARRGAIDDVLNGRIEAAIARCAKEWASLPGAPYGQPTKTLPEALRLYASYGGATEPAKTSPGPVVGQPEPPMPIAPFIAAALPSLIEAIPKLGRLFGSGSEVSERNVAAAETVVQIVKEATGTLNAQAAAEAVKSDPVKAAAAAKAIEDAWYQLAEAGGGGIEGARKADAERAAAGDFWRSPSFWFGLLLLPLVYLFVLSLIGIIGTASWSDDVRAGLAGSIVSAVIGGLVGYYFGQTTSRNRTPAG